MTASLNSQSAGPLYHMEARCLDLSYFSRTNLSNISAACIYLFALRAMPCASTLIIHVSPSGPPPCPIFVCTTSFKPSDQ